MTTPPRILWRYVRVGDLRCSTDGQSGTASWPLSAAERAELSHWRHPERREGWLLTRVVARRLIQAEGLAPAGDDARIEICSRDALGRSVRPEVKIDGRPASFSLSLSHTSRGVLVALCPAPGVSVGVDLVGCEPLSAGLVERWFTPRERAELCAEDPLAANRIWGIKEAVYKAVNAGDSFAPRQIEARRDAAGNYAGIYRGSDLADRCQIHLWACDEQIAALAIFGPQTLPLPSTVPQRGLPGAGLNGIDTNLAEAFP